ncbi:MBL fold metallo-hydrolase [Escherichia coli]
MLDVGQGLAMVIARNGKAILYDTGLAWPEGDSGQQLIIPGSAGIILKPEGVILSHEHQSPGRAGFNIAYMADVMDKKSVKLGTSSALCAWRSVAMARIAFQRALAFTR